MKISVIPASRVGHYNLFVLEGDDPHMIGTLVPGSIRRAEQIKKDLELMAAAPDLLAALREIDGITKPGESDPDLMAEMLGRIATIAASSITKAEV